MQLSDKVKPAIQGSHDLEEPSTAQTTKGKNLKTPPTKYLITFFLVVVFLTAVISLALSLDHRKSSPGNQWTKSNVPAEAEMEAANQVANEVLNLSRQLGEFRNDLQEQNYIIANLKFTSLQSLLSASPAPPGKNGTKGNTGEQGPPGLTGLTGLPGAQGLKGPEGRKGHEGPPGEKGDQGLPGLPGIEGVKGPYGVPGYSGPKGEPGADGPPGVLGQAGRTGFNGSQGPPGPPGPAGPRGPPGYNASRPNGSDAKDPSQVANKPSAQLMGGDHHEQLYATDQVLTKWNPNDTDSHLMYGFEYSQGKLRVPRDGRYHVYAQLHIKSTGQAPSNHVAVFAGNRSVLMIKARPVGEQTRFVAGVFQLAKGEMVYIKPIYETMIWLGPDLSCFGAYMI